MNKIPAIKIDGLHKRFGSLEVLRGINLRASDGDVMSIIGSSGSGKSTLLRCINLLEVPDSGDLWVAGEQVRLTVDRRGQPGVADNKQVDRIRTRVSMVFQNFNLWTHMTILANVMEGPVHVLGQRKSDVRERAMVLLDKVGIADKADSYPDHLSGGQQQRAAIARALAMEPNVMLFDEPTSALDPELVGEVLRVMQDLASEGRTMIVVTHEMGFAREVSNKVVFLHEGKVEEQGSPSDVFENARSERCRQFLASNLNQKFFS